MNGVLKISINTEGEGGLGYEVSQIISATLTLDQDLAFYESIEYPLFLKFIFHRASNI